MAYIPTGITSIVSTIPSSVQVGASIMGLTPVAVTNRPSISGTVDIGVIPGSILTFPGANQSVSGTVNIGTIPGSIVSYPQGTIVSSLVSTIPSSVLVGSSIFGQLPAGTAMIGSVAVLQGTSPWNIAGSVAATIQGTPNVNATGSVVAFQGGAWTPSVSGTIGASIIGLPPVKINDGTNLLQIYEENNIDASVAGLAMMFKSNSNTSIMSIVSPATPIPASVQGNVNVSGSVIAFPTGNQSVSGTVANTQQGTWITSLVSTVPSSVLVGSYAQRNDATASFLGGNLTWNPLATDSAGRPIVKPFSSEDGTIISYTGSVVSASVTLIQASTIGKRSYITDFLITNTGSVAQLITFQDGSTSVLGYTIAPAGGGSNAVGWNIPIRTAPSQDMAFKATGTTSVLYMTIKGYVAP